MASRTSLTQDPETSAIELDDREPQREERPEEAAPEFPAEPGERKSALRGLLPATCVLVGSAIMTGGIFKGIFLPRAYAVFGGVLGVLIAYALHRVRNIWLIWLGVAGIAATGWLAAVFQGGLDSFLQLGGLVGEALKQSRLLRPPIAITPGFTALTAWIMASLGYVAAWVALVIRRPLMAMFVPLPIAAISAISVPEAAQLGSGVALLVLFAAGLGIAAGDRALIGAEKVPLSYDLRRAAKAVPFVGAVTVALVLLAQTDFLFPRPLVNPELEAQRPRTTPITEVPDRTLFEVRSSVAGPWVMGVLDVYDGREWRLPPFSQAKFSAIPSSGVVDRTLQPRLRAQITVRGLGGAVLPSLPNTVGILAIGPRFNYDSRSGNIRLVEGEIEEGFTYTIAAAGLPDVKELVETRKEAPAEIQDRFTQAPRPPLAASSLIDQAPKTSKWEQWDWLRRHVLDNVTASGLGTPVPIPPERVQEVLASTKEASPFEIVAMQTLFARWIGVPARIGYGFDGGEKVGEVLEVSPRHGAVFPEVYFQGHGWLPVLGVPSKTKVTDTSDPNLQQFREGVLPSEDISVTIFRPVELARASRFYERVRDIALIAFGIGLVLALFYVLLPVIRKALRRNRARTAAVEGGPTARIAQAYAEWRDLLTDFGYRYEADTPLMLLRRFPKDEEHSQLAWLVTRALWGDLQDDVTIETAIDAEELSRSLRKRIAEAHPIAVRIVAAVSRLSLKFPNSFVVGSAKEAAKEEQEPERVAV